MKKQTELGYSLIEILVVLAIVGLMGLGTTTLVTNMLKLQKKNLLKMNLAQVQDDIDSNVRNEDAWLWTLCEGQGNPTDPVAPTCAAAPTLTTLPCLWENDNIKCQPPIPNTNPFDTRFAIYNRNGDVIVPDTSAAGTPTAGFNTDGESCNGFVAPPGGGNNACPFQYLTEVFLQCPGGETECLKPDVKVTATLVSNPGSMESLANRIEPPEFVVDVMLNQEVVYEPLEVIHTQTNNNPGGPCIAGTPVARPLTQIRYDVGNNIIINSLTGTSFTLVSGIYTCEVSAQGYQALGGFSIALRAGAVNYPIGSGFSALNGTAVVTGRTQLDLPGPTVVRVMHNCSLPSSVNSVFNMGIPVPNYAAGNSFTRVTCIRNK